MRVTLIHPPAFLNPTALTALRPSLPLGLAYIAGSLRAAGHEVSVIDAVGEAPDRIVALGRVSQLGLPVDEIVRRLPADVQVIGLSAMFTYQWSLVKDLIHALKAARPDVLLLGGGEHFTGLPEISLQESPIDIIALGEGEETAVSVLRAYDDFVRAREADGAMTAAATAATAAATNSAPVANSSDVAPRVAEWAAGLPGVAYRKDGAVVQEPRRDRVRDVDAIPLPAWDLFNVRGYDSNGLVTGIHKGVTVPILATRGCPYRCAYCSSPNMWTTKWLPRDPKKVADEIESYVETYGAGNFPFHDLTAILRREWVIDFCREILARKLQISWQLPSGTRCEVVDDEVASLLAQSGGWSLNFAPESGSEEVRKKVAKQMTEKSLFSAVDAAVKHGLNTSVFFVLGFPGDQVQNFRDTAAWARRLARAGVDDVAVGFYFPIPGTKFYRQLEAEGRVTLSEDLIMAPIFVHDRWLTEQRNFSGTCSARTLTYWRYRIVLAFYSRAILTNPKRLWRIARNFWSGREDSKFDSFLQILKERFFTRRAAKV
jgi:anaerobic magnesium-protoporphyrin IX monomethyl ester cyclase